MKLKILFALVAAALGVLLVQPAASATTPVSVHFTTHITHNEDIGHHGAWAFLDYDRTTTFTRTGDGTYTVTLTDDGTFTTIPGNASPRVGTTLLKQSGTFHGQYSLTVTTNATPSKTGVADSYDFKCDGKTGDRTKDCTGIPFSTSTWPALYLGGKNGVVPEGTKINGGPYSWTYKTCVEKWVDSSDQANDDGAAVTAGDITGKSCPTPTPSATTPAAQTSSASAPPAAAASTSLPTTGGHLGWLIAAATVFLLVGAAALALSRRRHIE